VVQITLLATAEEAEIAREIGNALAQVFGSHAIIELASVVPARPRTAYVFVVVIGPEWAHAIQTPQNQLQRQLLSSLLRYPGACLVLPVAVHTAEIPTASTLPPDLQVLPQLQFMPVGSIPDAEWNLQAIARRIRAFKLFSFLPLVAFALFLVVAAVLQVSAT
jgi:hypothetical protein